MHYNQEKQRKKRKTESLRTSILPIIFY